MLTKVWMHPISLYSAIEDGWVTPSPINCFGGLRVFANYQLTYPGDWYAGA